MFYIDESGNLKPNKTKQICCIFPPDVIKSILNLKKKRGK